MSLIAASGASYFGLSFTADWVASIPGLSLPAYWPPELLPGGTLDVPPKEFMGMALSGQWWVAIGFLLGWFLNIFGEEFWFRGYILPRQEVGFGGYAWLLHGILFTGHHLFQWWNLIGILPGALLVTYVVQRRKNTWISVIQHGALNLALPIIVVIGVLS